jgi:hypothetical protein
MALNRRSIVLALVLTVVSLAASAYDTMELEKDFKEVVRLGDRILKSSIKASRVLSETLVKDGAPTSSISTSQGSIVQQQLTSEDKDKIELQVSEMQAGNLGEFMPKPNNIKTEALEKWIAQKGKAPGKDLPANPAGGQNLRRNDKNLVARVFPDEKWIGEILVSTHQTSANPAKLDSDSVQLRDTCVTLFTKLVKRGETAARLKFAELLARKENQGTRWYFAGVAAMVAGFSEYERETAVQNLKKVIPDLQKESKTAAKAIDWDFAVAIESMPEAKASFQKNLNAKWELGTISNQTSSGAPKTLSGALSIQKYSAKRGWWSGSSHPDNKAKSKLSVNYWSESWNNMWGDMGDHLQANFAKGTQYGQKCGEFIGMASGIGQAYGKMAAERTTHNIVSQVRDYAYDTAYGEMGLKPDPYSIIGHFAGGAIGTLGGAIGNAAGWVVGTIDSIAAQRGSKPSRSKAREGTAAADPASEEMIKLF